MLENLLSKLIIVLPIAIVIALLLVVVSIGYVKAPTDKAYIISGFRKKRIIIGKASIRIPFLERKDELILQLIPIDVRTTDSVPTADFININVNSNVNVKIGTSPEFLDRAAENFLGKSINEIRNVAMHVLEGNIREIVGNMKLKDMITDRQKFSELVTKSAEPDLAKMGLEIVSFNVQNFSDDNNVIENLGVDNVVAIRKDAEISRANSERDIAVAKAQADKEKNDAETESQQAIAVRNNELAIKKADLKISEDTKKAEADAAYEIQQQEQRKTIEAKTIEADIVKQDKQVELKMKEAEVQEQELNASIKKKADADLYKAKQEAEADLFRRQKEAEAKKYEQEKEAEALKAKAEAQLVVKQKEAEGIEAVGKANAEAKRAELLAEAEGLDKKAEAMKKMDKAAVIQMVVDKLPDIVKNAAEPMSNIDKIVMYGGDNGNDLVGKVMNNVSQVNEGLSESLGIDIKTLIAGILGGKIASNAPVTIEQAEEKTPENNEDN